MNNNTIIGFYAEEAYCVECGNKEIYNIYKPHTCPEKCSKCGGRMTTYQSEKIMKVFEESLNKIDKRLLTKRK